MSLGRVAASAAIFTLLSAAGATAKPVTLATETNLRKAPGTDSEVLTLMPKGTTVEVGKCSNGWCETSLDGKDGFAIAQNLGMAPRRAPRVVEEEVEYAPPVYGPRPAYVYGPRPYAYGPPLYYGYGPYYGYYGGWGWGRRWW